MFNLEAHVPDGSPRETQRFLVARHARSRTQQRLARRLAHREHGHDADERRAHQVIRRHHQVAGALDQPCRDERRRAAEQLSDGEVTELQNMLGFDASASIEAKGWYLQIQDATAAVRAARASPPMTLVYTDGESIQQLDLASICVV